MKMRILVFFIVSLVGVGGCSLNGYQGVKPEVYPATKRAFDVTIGWKKTLTDDGMTVEGYARNNRYFIIRGLELRVVLVAANGTEMKPETFLFPQELRERDMAPFSVSLKARPQVGDRLRFIYRYLAVEDAETSYTWMNSFEVTALD